MSINITRYVDITSGTSDGGGSPDAPGVVDPDSGFLITRQGWQEFAQFPVGPAPERRVVENINVTTINGKPFGEQPGGILNGGRYIACLPMSQKAPSLGHAVDISGSGSHGILYGVSPATAWANAGYFTTDPTAGASGYLFIEGWREYWRSLDQVEANKKVIVFSMVFKTALPSTSSSPGFGCIASGPYWALRGTGASYPGAIQNSFRGTAGPMDGTQTPSVYLDGTDHTFTVVMDLASRRTYQYLDGALVLVAAPNVSTQPISPIVSDINPATVTEFVIGHNSPQLTATGQTATAMQVKGAHLIVLDGMPLNMQDVARRLHATPTEALDYNAFVMPDRRIVLADAGHSNSQGFGSNDRMTSSAGEPLFDPVWPNGSPGVRASMHPKITESMASLGTYAHILNTSVGTSGIVDHWCGRLRTWVSGMSAGMGSYVISDGAVWKITAQPTTGAVSITPRLTASFLVGTTAPTGTSNIPATTTVPGYTYLGPVTSADVPGTVYAYGDARFDPNGFVANLIAAVANTNPLVYERVVRLMFGNTDTGKDVTRTEWRQAMVNLANCFHQTLGAKTLLSMANRGDVNNVAATAEYNDKFLPGRLDAIAELSGSGYAFGGGNLVEVLGQLANNAATPATRPQPNVPYLLNEGGIYVHINDKAIRTAAVALAGAVQDILDR